MIRVCASLQGTGMLDLVIKHNNNKVPGQEVAGRPEAPGEVKRRLLGQ